MDTKSVAISTPLYPPKALIIIQSIAKLERTGESEHLCLSLLYRSKLSDTSRCKMFFRTACSSMMYECAATCRSCHTHGSNVKAQFPQLNHNTFLTVLEPMGKCERDVLISQWEGYVSIQQTMSNHRTFRRMDVQKQAHPPRF